MKKTSWLAGFGLLALTFLTTNAIAVNMPNASWYVHLDAKAIKQSAIINAIKEKKDKDYESFLDFALGQALNQQLQQLTIYGEQAGNKDFTLLLQGDFSKQAKKDFFNKLKLGADYSSSMISTVRVHQWFFDGVDSGSSDEAEKNQKDKVSGKTSIKHKNNVIKFNLDKEDAPLQLYSAELAANLIIVSRDLDEVESWIKGAYSQQQLNRRGLFSVVVHLDRAMAHGGMNFGADKIDLGFNSSVMKKVSQISFSLSELKKDVRVEVGLVTKDEKVAQQVKNIINGLLALKAIAGDEMDSEIKPFLDNLNIERDGVNVLLTSTMPKNDVLEILQ